MTLYYDFPSLGTHVDTRNFVVGAGVEAPLFPTLDPRTNIDISDTNIFVTYNSSGTWYTVPFNGFDLFDSAGTVPAITGVTINGVTNLGGLTASRVTFDADNVFVNWNGLSFNPQTVVSLDVQFAPANAVPIPSGLLMLGTGIASLAGLGRLRLRFGLLNRNAAQHMTQAQGRRFGQKNESLTPLMHAI